ncbi:ABC transporter ATP-binding protein [Paenibacillus sp. MER TA 81-3]|uniref:ABC transporter ATP-binding protein n=1 Tax=Paenibacillus sp. MER TA 81-3 TaxID=2939573 RepID=UPI0020410A9B|nr:ABC transporter ATP-binding protein [Paenibacillus sp. MER TA 81-3]MCM3339231.1 ABC transporter ATP-binding protein [Paenibacillus sp. MER TA 81-3]
MITVTSVSKKYGDKLALDNINLHVNEGEIYAILGHNGAGKTTLIKCIMDLMKYEGDITYSFDQANLYQNISLQMQTSVFEEGVRVMDICKLYKDILNSKVNIKELLKQFDLEEHSKSYVNKLSGGQKQKLSILLTLINEPKVIIFDELTTGLDVMARRKTWNLLKDINKEKGITLLLTSHFLDEVEYLADNVIILEKGKESVSGSVEEIIENSFGDRKKISFGYKGSDENKEDFTFPYWIDDKGKYIVEYNSKDESQIFNEISQKGGYDININRFSFEDAFLKILGYRMTEKGEIKDA